MIRQKSNNIWMNIFQDLQEKELGSDYDHVWSLNFQYDLINKLTPEHLKEGWKMLQLNISGSFVCSNCSDMWKSGLFRLLFHYRLMKPKRGLVLLGMCREQCSLCNCSYLEKPTIEKDEIQETLKILIMKIRENCYNEYSEPPTHGPTVYPPTQLAEIGAQRWNNVWMDTFQVLQERHLKMVYGHAWSLHFQHDLMDKLTPGQQKEGWNVFKLNPFGSFVCSQCSNEWKSGHIPLLFHYRSIKSKRGLVRLRMCREQCSSCKCPGLEKPTIEQDKIQETLMSLILKIKQKCYKNMKSTTQKPPRVSTIYAPSQNPEMKIQTYNNVWMDTFQDLQEKELRTIYGNAWSLNFQYNLTDKLTSEQQKDGWNIFKLNSFGSFVCSKCSYVWKSGVFPLLFHYCSIKSKRGLVRLNMCREQCSSCKCPDLEKPTIDQDKIREALMALIMKVKQKCYNEKINPPTRKPPRESTLIYPSQKPGLGRKNFNNIWMDTFQDLQEMELGKDYGHVWSLHFQYDLIDNLTLEQKQEGWKIFTMKSFGSFVCLKCSNYWKSGLITLMFHYRLINSKKGLVKLRIYRQQCRRCKYPNLEKPTIEEHEVQESLITLILKIRKNCYNEITEKSTESSRGSPHLTKPHERNLCEACLFGTCQKSLG
ncbi:uncharacterized protein O3C94_005448 isoform 1-T2 [Discoglossus pictus]